MDVKKIVSQSKFAQVGFVVNDVKYPLHVIAAHLM